MPFMWPRGSPKYTAAGLMKPSAGLIHARGYWAGGKKCALPYTRPYTVPSARLGWEAVLEEMVARHGLPYGRSCWMRPCKILRKRLAFMRYPHLLIQFANEG